MFDVIIPVVVIIVVLALVFASYCLGYKMAMDKATEMFDDAFDKKFRDAGIVVRQDDRIIECNGVVSKNCTDCIFGRQLARNAIQCLAVDFDGGTVGLRKGQVYNCQ